MNVPRRVTIGIPVYNEERFIEATIRSAAPQCDVLLVADNCSTDASAEICRRLAGEYPNMIFHRHAVNGGANGNFAFIMQEARTPYFMWLGAHDLLPPGYVRRLRGLLDSEETSALAFGDVVHIDRDDRKVFEYRYKFAGRLADDNPNDRLFAIIRYLFDCSLIHGLFRTEHLARAWEPLEYLKGDHVLLARIILGGKFLHAGDTFLLRRQVRAEASGTAQLERITGARQAAKVRPGLKGMQRALKKMADNESAKLGAGALAYRMKSHFWLVARFGPFSPNRFAYGVEMLLYHASRATRLGARNLDRALAMVRGGGK